VGRPAAPDARDERERSHRRSGRTGRKERMLFVWKQALSVPSKFFFLLMRINCNIISFKNIDPSIVKICP